MDNLFFISPSGNHNVFNGWHKFFSKYFNYKVFCEYENLGLPDRKDLYQPIGKKTTINFKNNYLNIYTHKQKFKKNDILLIGDIFVNSLSYTLKKGKRLYYSEFFIDEKPFIIKLIFYIVGFLCFYNKKFIVPHELGYKTFKKISKKCYYLPILYDGDICYSEKKSYETIELLFAGRIDAPVKNIDFLINNYLELNKVYKNVNLTLIGKISDENFYMKYEEYFKTDKIKYIARLEDIKDLWKIYAKTDIFILPSLEEPIGAVIQESMAHGCAVIASNTCGGACFIEEGKNGYVFKVNDSEDFRNKIELLLNDTEKLKSFKKKSTDLIKEKYDINHDKLMKQYFDELNQFIFS